MSDTPSPTEQAIAPVSAVPHAVARLARTMGRFDGPPDMDGKLRLATELSKARFILPPRYRNNPGDVLALIYHAQTLDIGVATAWENLVFNPDGVGAMRARLMHGLVIRAGHRLVPVHVDSMRVRMRLIRCDGGTSGGAAWTLAEAQRAGLAARDNSPWRPYSEDMLWARCMSRVCRRYASDVIMGFYVPEDLVDAGGGPPVDDLAPHDLSVITDVDGNPLPAPDVEELLRDLDTLTFAELVNRRKMAEEEGKLGAFAGAIDGIHFMVEELLFDHITRAAAREGIAAPGGHQQPAAAPAGNPTAGQPPQVVDLDVLDAPVGSGARLPCGCAPADVLASGGHGDGCTGTSDTTPAGER